MDRNDEYKGDERDVEVAGTGTERTGDVLGLGSGPVVKSPDDPSTEFDPESVAKRRARVRGEGDEGVQRTTEPAGAGIDMGAGGSGTDISGN